MKMREDLRIIKTKESFFNAYIQIMENKGVLRVLKICETASKTNNTFYHHYSNKIDLSKHVVDQQLQHILPIPEKLKPSGYKQYFYYLVNTITTFFIKNKCVISNSLEQLINKSYKNSYLDVLNKTLFYKAFNESNNYVQSNPSLQKTMIDWFVGGLLNVLYSSIRDNQNLNPKNIWESIKLIVSIINKINF